MVDYTERDSPTHTCECGFDAAIASRIIGIRKTTSGGTTQQARPVERVPSRVFARHKGSDHCVHQPLHERTRALTKVTRVLVKCGREKKGCKESCRRFVCQSRSQSFAVSRRALSISGLIVTRLREARREGSVAQVMGIDCILQEQMSLVVR